MRTLILFGALLLLPGCEKVSADDRTFMIASCTGTYGAHNVKFCSCLEEAVVANLEPAELSLMLASMKAPTPEERDRIDTDATPAQRAKIQAAGDIGRATCGSPVEQEQVSASDTFNTVSKGPQPSATVPDDADPDDAAPVGPQVRDACVMRAGEAVERCECLATEIVRSTYPAIPRVVTRLAKAGRLTAAIAGEFDRMLAVDASEEEAEKGGMEGLLNDVGATPEELRFVLAFFKTARTACPVPVKP